MNKKFGYCGLNCSECDAYIATINNDQDLKEKTAKLWARLNNTPITADQINCEGCKGDGAKTYFCGFLCQIRQCASKKDLENCGYCEQFPDCPTLKTITDNNPQALANLKEL